MSDTPPAPPVTAAGAVRLPLHQHITAEGAVDCRVADCDVYVIQAHERGRADERQRVLDVLDGAIAGALTRPGPIGKMSAGALETFRDAVLAASGTGDQDTEGGEHA